MGAIIVLIPGDQAMNETFTGSAAQGMRPSEDYRLWLRPV